MRKIFIVLLSVLAVVGLVGCKKKKQDPDTTPETTVTDPSVTPEPSAAKVSFVDHRSDKTVAVVEAVDGVVAKPADPTRTGFRFEGWFSTKRGLTWLEDEAIEFPLSVSEDTTVYAYWEPISSAYANWAPGETYVSSMSKPPRLIMNPLDYRWSHEDELIDMLSSSLYSTEVDWGKAIEEGIADFAGDFSKFESQEYSIEALDYHYILVAGAEYPMTQDGETAVVDGAYDRDLAQELEDDVWTYNIREDLTFQDGTPIDAYTFEYTLKNWVDPDQNNFRANMWYKTDANPNGRPVKGVYEYLNQVKPVLDPETGEHLKDEEDKPIYEDAVVDWEEVGFKVTGKYSFEFHLTEEVSLSSAVGLGNALKLVHPTAYEASLDQDGVNSQYGTPAYPYQSYGPFVLKSWDENAKIVFNKNYDYVLKGTINYKSHEIQIVDDVDQAMDLFKDGALSVIGLTKDYYAEFAEDPGVKSSWVNFPQYLIINLSNSKKEGGHVHQPILEDARLRQALLYGFDRSYFANNVYAPNTPALLPIPINAKHYLFDPLYYAQSPQHLALLDELGIDTETEGYMPTRAVDLFEEALADAIEDGHTGPVTLRLVADNDDFSDSLLDFIKESYETLFEKDGVKRLVIDVKRFDDTGLEDEQKNLNFDLTLTALGFNSSVEAFWQYAAIALLPGYIGATDFGLNHPFIGDGEEEADYMDLELEIDVSYTLDYLETLDEERYAEFREMIDEEGILRGDVFSIFLHGLHNPNPYDGGPKEPFPGASHDLNNITAAFEKIFFEYAPVVPTVTRSSATLYADNVTIDWPFYSEAFGWGAARYRYMNTDVDFQ